MPKVVVPPPYQGPTQGHDVIAVEAATIRACLEAVDRQYPGFGAQIFDASGAPHRFVKLFHNGDPVAADALDSQVGAEDTLELLAPIAGG